ncbi:MAG TPA: type II toxin-antitoxin system VapC family toxin [Dehalococcoidia bacterium]|nr:type II toxin-antitoxin system VapC family toxin [Dehalococcoidia bacterium]
MLLVDVNVLVYAHRTDTPNHIAYRHWLEDLINGNQAYAMTDIVLSEFIRVVTHPRVFNPASEIGSALTFVREIREQPNCVLIAPGTRHWAIFVDLCQASGAKGSLVPDAFLAALAIESGSEWITTDRDYSRFPGLRCRHPLAA